MFIYLGEVVEEKLLYIYFDTVSERLECIEHDEYDLVKKAVQLDIMKAVCMQLSDGDSYLLPYSDTYIKMEKFIRAMKMDLARKKLIGKTLNVHKPWNVLMDGEYYITQAEGNRVVLHSEENALDCIFGEDYSLEKGLCDVLTDWELVDMINKYDDEVYDRRGGCNVGDFFKLSNGISLGELIGGIKDIYGGTFNIGFLKRSVSFFCDIKDNAQLIGTDNCVVKFKTESDKFLIFSLEDCEVPNCVSYIFEGCFNPENIVWLSHDVTRLYL